MNRRQSICVLLGTFFVAATSKAAHSQPSVLPSSAPKPANPKLVEKLTKMLAQAQSGELTSFSAVAFKRDGSVDLWGEFSRKEDLDRVVEQLETLKQSDMGLIAKVKAAAKG